MNPSQKVSLETSIKSICSEIENSLKIYDNRLFFEMWLLNRTVWLGQISGLIEATY